MSCKTYTDELSNKKSERIDRNCLNANKIIRGNYYIDDKEVVNDTFDIIENMSPNTLLTRREAKFSNRDANYVSCMSELTEMSNSTESTTSSDSTSRVLRIHTDSKCRVLRSRKIAEIRRNSMHLEPQEKQDKDLTYSRRLLSTKRKKKFIESRTNKRIKSTSTMPYMNTRSVTRKLYNIGATYKAPTISDECEWKEWPVHGMHERPVFHPQVGLATEYIGQYFVSLDGHSYCQIVNKYPEITNVKNCHKVNNPYSGKESLKQFLVRNTINHSFASSEENKYFKICMHSSLHFVFAYCSQVGSPSYRKNVLDRIRKLKNIVRYKKMSVETVTKLENVHRVMTSPSCKLEQEDAVSQRESEKFENSSLTNAFDKFKNKKFFTVPLHQRAATSTINVHNNYFRANKLQAVLRQSAKDRLIFVKSNSESKMPTSRLLISDSTACDRFNKAELENSKRNAYEFASTTAMSCNNNNAKYDNGNEWLAYERSNNKVWSNNTTTKGNVIVKNASQQSKTSKLITTEKPVALETAQLVRLLRQEKRLMENVQETSKIGNKNDVTGEDTDTPIMKMKVAGKKVEMSDLSDKENFESLCDLLENTALLYCAASGIHQDDLANYIDTLDAKESISWLEERNKKNFVWNSMFL